jgi:hypothetical protein
MRFTYNGTDTGLTEAAAFAEVLSNDAAFWTEAESLGPFKQTDVAADEIVRRLKTSTQVISIHHYTADGNDTVAATDRRYKNKIWYSDRHIGNSVAEKVNTLVHEFVHCVDYWGDGDTGIEYSHSADPSPDRPRSAPYAIGNLAEIWCRWVGSHGRNDKEMHPTASDVIPAEKFSCGLGLSGDDIVEARAGECNP